MIFLALTSVLVKKGRKRGVKRDALRMLGEEEKEVYIRL